MLAAETGSGKTLAYLLPLLQRLQTYPVSLPDISLPVGVIFVPNAALVSQLGKVIEALAPDVFATTVCMSSEHEYTPRPAALLVTTPVLFARVR
jgi:superfamily II DNA/RNA helicase